MSLQSIIKKLKLKSPEYDEAIAILEAAEKVDNLAALRNFMMLLWNDYERMFEAGLIRDRIAGRFNKYDKEKIALEKDCKYYHEIMNLLESLPEEE